MVHRFARLQRLCGDKLWQKNNVWFAFGNIGSNALVDSYVSTRCATSHLELPTPGPAEQPTRTMEGPTQDNCHEKVTRIACHRHIAHWC